MKTKQQRLEDFDNKFLNSFGDFLDNDLGKPTPEEIKDFISQTIDKLEQENEQIIHDNEILVKTILEALVCCSPERTRKGRSYQKNKGGNE